MARYDALDLGTSPDAMLAVAVERISSDREHGASWLARAAAGALAQAAGHLLERDADDALLASAAAWRSHARELALARPSMAALATTVARIYAAGWPPRTQVLAHTGAAARIALTRSRAEAEHVMALWEASAGAIATHARPLLRGTLLTHSRSATVERVLAALTANGSSAVERVIVTEARPGGEGVGLAGALAASGLPVTLIADAAVGMLAHEARCVVVGADSVRADGSVVNKIGTSLLALAARAAGIPLYVLTESLKIAPRNWPLVLEETDSMLLLRDPIPGVTVHTTVFDLTPAAHVTALLTERGALSHLQVRQRAASAARKLSALDPFQFAATSKTQS
jgi:translation initiation factor 2B subunit (eIF-2B alpha/beta/delta family)